MIIISTKYFYYDSKNELSSVQLPLFVGIVFSKSQYSYETCFNIIVDYFKSQFDKTLNLDFVFIDFERSEMNGKSFFFLDIYSLTFSAVKKVLQPKYVAGCVVHFIRNIRKNLNKFVKSKQLITSIIKLCNDLFYESTNISEFNENYKVNFHQIAHSLLIKNVSFLKIK